MSGDGRTLTAEQLQERTIERLRRDFEFRSAELMRQGKCMCGRKFRHAGRCFFTDESEKR